MYHSLRYISMKAFENWVSQGDSEDKEADRRNN